VLGQSDKWVEYMPEVDATSRYEATDEGLKVSVVRAQRIYNNHQWPNPIVIKLENVTPAFRPPAVSTQEANAAGQLQGELHALGDDKELEVGFYYRLKPQTLNEITTDAGWKILSVDNLKTPGQFEAKLPDLPKGVYQFRAYANHDKITVKGEIKEIRK
jgi:alpha-L-fucosidase